MQMRMKWLLFAPVILLLLLTACGGADEIGKETTAAAPNPGSGSSDGSVAVDPENETKQSSGSDHSVEESSGAETSATLEDLPDLNNFRVLFSTLGYQTEATKHILIRTLKDVSSEDINPEESTWNLKNGQGETVATGKLQYTGKTFGIQLWEADFSNFAAPGTYHMEIELKKDACLSVGTLKSLDFKIERDLLLHHVLKHITFENAEARTADPLDGNGYYDCNWSNMGEGYSHGIFLNALSQTYLLRGDRLTDDEKARLMKAADIAFDYLLSLQKSNGLIDHQYRTRQFYQGEKFGIMNTQEALYGMAAFLDIFKGKDTRANDENYEKVLKTLQFMENRAPWGWQAGYDTYGEYLIPVYYHLYKYSGDITFKEKAIKKLNFLMKNINIRSMWRSSLRAIPLFEGLKYCANDFKDDPNYDYWIERANYIKDTYFKYIIDNNAFDILPVSTLANAKAEWDDMTKTPMTTVAYNAATAYSIDACILGELTGDSSMKQIAAGGMNWVLGLNPGIPKWAISNPESNSEIQSAALIGNLDARCVIQEYNVWKPKNNTFMSISNGLNVDGRNWYYENRWNESENFIKTDGVYAFAVCIYEDYLNSLEN